jgi:hypothetical protein
MKVSNLDTPIRKKENASPQHPEHASFLFLQTQEIKEEKPTNGKVQEPTKETPPSQQKEDKTQQPTTPAVAGATPQNKQEAPDPPKPQPPPPTATHPTVIPIPPPQAYHVSDTKAFNILAIGKPVYGRLAYNLAASIKVNEQAEHYSVNLYYHGNALKSLEKYHYQVFDNVIYIPDDYAYYKGHFAPFLAKLKIYRLAKAWQNVFIDADTICFPTANFDKVFEEMKDFDFYCSTHRILEVVDNKLNGKIHIWIDGDNLLQQFPQIKKLVEVSTFFMYYKNKPYQIEPLEKAIEIYQDVLDGKLNIYNLQYRNSLADEPIVSLALELTQTPMPIVPYYPICFPLKRGEPYDKMRSIINSGNHIGLTIPGHPESGWYALYYNKLVQENNIKMNNWKNFFWDASKI